MFGFATLAKKNSRSDLKKKNKKKQKKRIKARLF
jgi:hypothetical protein